MDDNPISILIADDEPHAREELRHLLSSESGFYVIGEARDGMEALELIISDEPEIILLDIEMPGLNGIQVAGRCRGQNIPSQIIFTTAYDSYAVKAFEVHAVDYLMKPIRDSRLREALSKAGERVKASLDPYKGMESLLREHLLPEKPESRFISVYRGGALQPFSLDKILFAEARGRNVWIVTENGEFQTNFSFQKVQTILKEPDFFACHRSFIVNLSAIECIDLAAGYGYEICFPGQKNKVPVSRSKVQSFRNLMGI